MDFEDTEKIIEKAKTQPKKTIVIIIVFAIIAIAVAYATSFFSEKAKQHATPSKTTQKELSAPANSAGKSRNNEKTRNNYKIEQHTEGDQSPAIVSDGDVKIEYGDDK